MNSKIYLTVVLAAASLTAAHAQTNFSYTIDSLQHFDRSYWLDQISRYNPTPSEEAEFITAHKKQYIKDTYFPNEKVYPDPNQVQQSCTNIDFEAGTTSGWTSSTGFHPLFNSSGCCPTSGGAQAIMSGTAVDPCGGFPVVSPGGNFSLRLGNNSTGGVADRIEQTFAVTASNANFTYKYAVVFQDPGHTLNEQPSFQIEMLDSTGTQIPCTFYNVAAGQNIPGFLTGSCPSTVYKPWTNVVVDLTSYIGQNVTIRFTTYDCALGGHYGYAYIDGSCMQFQLATADTICVGGSKNICAPTGFGSYVWNGPNVTNLNAQCCTVNSTGIYTVQTTLVTGCVGPVFTYSIYNYTQPNPSFATVNNTCLKTVSFNNTSTISSGSVSSYLWNFGDGGTSTSANPTHTYANAGTYTTSLIAYSNHGCSDTTQQVFTIYDLPNVTFLAPVACQTAAFNFTNTSTVSSGTINIWVWNFGDGSVNSTLQNPSHIYATAGNFTVTLNATSSLGCSNSNTMNLTVRARPTVLYSYNSACIGSITQFTNNSFVTGGTITNWDWDFDNNSVIDNTNQNPGNVYPAAGSYIANLIATSNFGCVGSATNVVVINPDPSVAFITNNACQGSAANFINQSTIPTGNSISTYTWAFGNGNSSNAATPNPVYAAAGNYTVTLSATSNNGCSSYTSQPVTIYPLPYVNPTAPNQVCQNAPFVFGNTSSISSGSIVSWLWTFGNGMPNSTLQTPSTTYTNSMNYIVNLTATSNLGCANSNSIVVFSYPQPNVNFAVNNVCHNSLNTFTNTSTIATGNITNWIWDFNNDGFPDNNTQQPNYTYPSPGTYSVVLTGVSNANCVNTFTKTVTIYPNPVVNIVGNNVCNGASTTFSNQSTISSGNIISYNWNFGNGSTSNQTNPQMTYANYGSYNVNLTAVSNNNCSSQNSITVNVYSNPNVNFSSTTACLNQATQFYNTTIIAGGTIIKWLWDFDGNGSWDDSTASPSHVYPNYASYNAKLFALSNNNCPSQKVNVVVVHANPTANFKTNSTCLGDMTAFTNLSSCPDGTLTAYLWDFNGDNITDNTFKNPTHLYSANGVYLTNLEVQSQYGCVNIMSKSVYVNPKPNVMFASANKVGCPSFCTNFTNSSSISNGHIQTYQWQFGDGSIPAYDINPTHCYDSGNYDVTLKVVSDSGCIASRVETNYIVVYPRPVAGFYATPEQIEEDQPLVQVTDASTGASSVTYWLNDGGFYNIPNFSHNFNTTNMTQKALIYQYVKNSFGCSDSTVKVLDIKPSYVIYVPNAFTPNSDGLNDGFGAKGVGIEKFQMWIFDRWGHLVFETNDINKTWDGTIRNSADAIKQDVYVWKAQVLDVFHKNHDLVGNVTVLKSE